MHDRLDHHRMNEDAVLAAALRALPADTPLPNAWPRLAARARRRRQVRHVTRIALPAALAACIALVFAWPHVHLHRSMQPPVRIAQPTAVQQQPVLPQTAPRHTPPAADVAALQMSSRQWQAWVATLDREGAPLDGRALATAVALQDRIGLVDLQLSAARNPTTVASLWQERITLLQQLGLLHLQPYLVAEQSRPTHAIVM